MNNEEFTTLDDIPEEQVVPRSQEMLQQKTPKPKSWLENKRVALILAIVGFAVIILIFGLLFSTIDWELILSQ